MFKFALAAAMAVATLSAYAQMDAAQMAAARAKAQPCAACHGPDGNSQNPDYPILAGQTWRYIYIELKDFQEGRRSDPQMSPMAAGLSRDDMVALFLANFSQAGYREAFMQNVEALTGHAPDMTDWKAADGR